MPFTLVNGTWTVSLSGVVVYEKQHELSTTE